MLSCQKFDIVSYIGFNFDVQDFKGNWLVIYFLSTLKYHLKEQDGINEQGGNFSEINNRAGENI